MSKNITLPARNEVPIAETWALESIFPTPADWEAACATLQDLLPDLAAYRGRLHENP
jgi:oligoendopeptidase F